MNGVRRFLTGGGTPTSQQFPQPPTTPPPLSASQSQSPSVAPLSIAAKPSWPPSPLQSPTEFPQVGSPNMTTAALFLRKDRQKPIPTASASEQGSNTSFHSPQSSRESNGVGSPARSQVSSAQLSSPVAGPSSPRPLPSRVSELARKPIERPAMPSLDVKRTSEMFTTRDDLLMTLLASEAIVDSRGYDILSAEEVEELKKEHQVLSARLTAMNKKLSLETKIRDAALSLSKANASYKTVSKQSSDQLEAANRKVEAAQTELWRVSERANDIYRRLLEHRAGVLSYSVRSLEKKSAPIEGDSSTSGYSTPNRSLQMSPTPSSATSVTTASSRGRFEHFFAGHQDTIVPQVPRLPPTIAEVVVLEEKLKLATATLQTATKKQVEMARELSVLRLEKEQIEISFGMDLQTAEETISALEQEALKADGFEAQLRELEAEREAWTQNRAELDVRRQEVDALEQRLQTLEAQSGDAAEAAGAFAQERQERQAQLEALEEEMAEMQARWETERKGWDEKRAGWEAERAEWDTERARWDEDQRLWEAEKAALQDGATSKTELIECADALRELMHTHGILLSSRDPSLQGLIISVGRHLEGLHSKLDAHARAEEEWMGIRNKLEVDIRAGLDKREALFEEIEEARRARDDARSQIRDLEAQLREQTLAQIAVANIQTSQAAVEYTGDAAQIVALLRPIWAILPSPEARASKLGARSVRSGSPSSPSPGRNNSSSLSEMDVRSLKTLYDLRATSSQSNATFTVEAFVARVQALVGDDRALIERLIRFAQAHDLLKKNAERAQKLAQESNAALETYQKQVKMLEDRNITMMARQAQLEDEVQYLQDAMDRISTEKVEVEAQAAEQAETCRQLTDANNVLSARTLALAEDAASAGDSVRKQMEAQLAECNTALARAREEIEAMHSSQQTQQMALLEELNSMQTENANLRAQLRKK